MTDPAPQVETLMVTLYTKPACVQCDATKRWLDRHGVPWVEVALSEESTAAFQAQGILAAPVIVLPSGEAFGGFQVTRLERLLHA